jgi:hypothetical protein
MTSRVVIWLLSAGAITLAVGPLAHYGESAASTLEAAAPAAASTSSSTDVATSLELSIHDGVAFALHVTNTSDGHLELDFPNGKTHDFAVFDSLGRQVWQWSDGRMFTQTVRNKLLDSQETITYEERWHPGPRTGRFTAVARLESSNHPVEERVEFTLP